MSIERAIKDKDNPYFLVAREAAQDDALSWEARGVLYYLLSKPDNWKVQPKDLEQGCGRQKVYRVLNELIETGYLTRKQGRNDKQKFRPGEYLVHEKPCDEKPYTENQHVTEYREEQNTENTLTDATENAETPTVLRLDVLEKPHDPRDDIHEIPKANSPFMLTSHPVVQPDGTVVDAIAEERRLGKPISPSSPVAPDSVSPAPKISKPKKPPKPRERNLVFDAIALGSFNGVQVNGNGGRIGKLVKGIKASVTPEQAITLAEDLSAMYAWYKQKYPNLSAPTQVETIYKFLAEWRQRPELFTPQYEFVNPDGTSYLPEQS